MLISITGTPGTGKTGVAEILAEKMGAKLISIGALVEKGKIRHTYDRKRKTKEIARKDMERAVKKETDRKRTNIIEGHLGHLIKADCVFVLRCNPKELCRRLEARKWDRQKIEENVTAEFVDLITTEAIGKNRRVFEIDTSRRSAKSSASLIKDILNSYSMQRKYRPKTDWTEKYKGFMIKEFAP